VEDCAKSLRRGGGEGVVPGQSVPEVDVGIERGVSLG